MSLQIDAGDFVGVGTETFGKSTLLRVTAGLRSSPSRVRSALTGRCVGYVARQRSRVLRRNGAGRSDCSTACPGVEWVATAAGASDRTPMREARMLGGARLGCVGGGD